MNKFDNEIMNKSYFNIFWYKLSDIYFDFIFFCGEKKIRFDAFFYVTDLLYHLKLY